MKFFKNTIYFWKDSMSGTIYSYTNHLFYKGINFYQLHTGHARKTNKSDKKKFHQVRETEKHGIKICDNCW